MQGGFAYYMTGVFLALVLSSFSSFGEEEKKPVYTMDRDSVESRLENVRRLLNTSSGAKRVAEDGAEAQALQAKAKEYLTEAEAALQKDDMESAHKALKQASLTMFEAIRKAGAGKMGVEKQQNDYKHKRASLDALLDALERITKEKGGNQQQVENIRGQAEAADRLAEAGQLQEAQVKLDQAYDTLRHEVEQQRSGDTLVRPLKFETKEEEYAYELDRNETHEMVYKLLVGDKPIDAQSQSQIDAFMAEAKRLRKQAEEAAAAGRHQEGIKLLEQSTQQLVKAIRRAGVYIPG